MVFGRSKRHFQRYKEIASVLAKHGWGWILGSLGLSQYFRHKPGVSKSAEGAVHLRQMLEELGPTFVKLGQLLSTRPDLVPEPYLTELKKLQDTAPTLPFTEIRAVIEEEFEAPIAEIYQYFDETPLAAASLAQVHKAVLLDGTPVIVKVQRPGIQKQVETDIEIIYKRAQFVESHIDVARTYGLMDIVDEFAITIREELDFTREASNTDRLRQNMADVKDISVPLVYWDLTTRKVLTLEQMQGIKITSIVGHPGFEVDPKEVSHRLASAFLEQIFVDGFFHADPHPGNILVSETGCIALVDCGQVGMLDAESKAGAVRLLMAFEQRDTRVLADEVMELGIEREEVDVKRFTLDLNKLLRQYYDLPSRSVNMGQLLMNVLGVSAQHKIRLPVSFTVLGKVLNNVDGICRTLNPDFNFTDVARSYVGRAMKSELRSENTVAELYRALVSLRTFILTLPENMERLMRRAVEGQFRIEFKHLGLEDIDDAWTTAANRISIALIVMGSIIGSSIVVSAGTGARWMGIPVIGIAGYIIAMVFGVWLILSILKSGRRRK